MREEQYLSTHMIRRGYHQQLITRVTKQYEVIKWTIQSNPLIIPINCMPSRGVVGHNMVGA